MLTLWRRAVLRHRLPARALGRAPGGVQRRRARARARVRDIDTSCLHGAPPAANAGGLASVAMELLPALLRGSAARLDPDARSAHEAAALLACVTKHKQRALRPALTIILASMAVDAFANTDHEHARVMLRAGMALEWLRAAGGAAAVTPAALGKSLSRSCGRTAIARTAIRASGTLVSPTPRNPALARVQLETEVPRISAHSALPGR